MPPQFAKHIKLQESVEFLKTKRTGLAVGTPARLIDLLENGQYSSSPSFFIHKWINKIVFPFSQSEAFSKGLFMLSLFVSPPSR